MVFKLHFLCDHVFIRQKKHFCCMNKWNMLSQFSHRRELFIRWRKASRQFHLQTLLLSCVLWEASCLYSLQGLCLFVCPRGAFVFSLKRGKSHAQADLRFGWFVLKSLWVNPHLLWTWSLSWNVALLCCYCVKHFKKITIVNVVIAANLNISVTCLYI